MDYKQKGVELFNPFFISAVSKTVFAPLERYRLIRQTQDLLVLYENDRLKNLFSFTQKIIAKDGFFKLWKSNLTAIYMYLPQLASQYFLFDNIKVAVIDDKNSYLMNSFSAALCGWTTMAFSYPFDTIRVRQATEFGVPKEAVLYKSFSDTFSRIKLYDGLFKGLYSGLSIGVFHTGLLAFGTLGLKNYVENNKIGVSEEYNLIQQEYSSEISFFICYSLLYPLDSIKYRWIEFNNKKQEETLDQDTILPSGECEKKRFLKQDFDGIERSKAKLDLWRLYSTQFQMHDECGVSELAITGGSIEKISL